MANSALPGITKRLRKVRQGYFFVQRDTAFTSGTAAYRVPTRSMHGAVSLVQRLDSSSVLHHLKRWTENELAGRDMTLTGTPEAFLFRGNSVVYWPIPDANAGSMRFTYPRRPNQLVAVATVGVVTGSSLNISNQASITISVNYSTLSMTTSTPLDVIQAAPPFDSLADDVTPVSIASNSALFAAGAVSTLPAVGDYVCLAQQAPVLQLPVEAFAVVAQMVANQLLAEDPAALKKGLVELKNLEDDLYTGASDRDDEEPAAVGNTVWP
jgi:hypothetical protein